MRVTDQSRARLLVLSLLTLWIAPVGARADAGLEEASESCAAEQSAHRNEELIWAARACYLEASFRRADCVALLWVARKRAQRVARPWLAVLRDYSALNADNPRARMVREFPWADVPGRTSRWNRHWSALRQLVLEVDEGEHPDPCPRAEHWGGSMDRPRGRMVPARCAEATANTFYALGRR